MDHNAQPYQPTCGSSDKPPCGGFSGQAPQGGQSVYQPPPRPQQAPSGAFSGAPPIGPNGHALPQHLPQRNPLPGGPPYAPKRHGPSQAQTAPGVYVAGSRAFGRGHVDPQHQTRLRGSAESFVPKTKGPAKPTREAALGLSPDGGKLDSVAPPCATSEFPSPPGSNDAARPSGPDVPAPALQPPEAARPEGKQPLRGKDLFDSSPPAPAPARAGQSPTEAANRPNFASQQQPQLRGYDSQRGGRGKQERSKPQPPFVNSKLVLPPGSPKPAPAEAIKFDSTWTVYADSNVVQLGAPLSEPSYNPVRIETVADMKEFWTLWRAVPAPSHRVPNFTYFWFRKKINPTWEDPRNKNGGTLNVVLWDRDRVGLQDRDFIDDAWITVVMALTGETLAASLLVNGLAIKIRQRNITLQVWTYNAAKSTVTSIGEALRKLIGSYFTKGLEKLEFYAHAQNSPAPQPKQTKGRKDMGRPLMPKREPDFVV